MSRKSWKALGTALVLFACATTAGVVSATPAHATVTTLSWPGTPKNYSTPYVHGDGSVTVGVVNSGCSFTNTTPVDVTMTPTGTITGTTYGASGSWYVCGMQQKTVVGPNRTIYVTETNPSTGAYRIAAIRDGVQLWTVGSFSNICTYPSYIQQLALGNDGKLYAIHAGSGITGCTGKAFLDGINALTGHLDFSTQLPGPDDGLNTGELMPYENGMAIANNGTHIYYYNFDGSQDTSKTFSPSVSLTSPHIGTASGDNSGRVYMEVYGYSGGVSTQVLYVKDTSSSTISTISLPSGLNFINALPAPSGDVVLQLRDSSNYDYIAYYDSSGALQFQKNLGLEGCNTILGRPSVVIDSLGNVIVARTMGLCASPNDQEVYVDSFDTSGTKTRLFDSEAQFGSSSKDIFTTEPLISQSIGEGKIYIVLCHQTSGSANSCYQSTATPQIVAFTAPGSFDYPRSAYFNAPNQYVALGDSYASGEGNPPFEVGTDSDGCDRSENDAYPKDLQIDQSLSLRAFAACSGATSGDIISGYNGEPSQLYPLTASTDIVTVTAGGDDAGFSAFAAACVNPLTNCGTDSSAYANAMDYVSNYLEGNLEQLYSAIRDSAPNAEVFVAGYPQVAPLPGGTCTWFTDSEKTAARNLVTALNEKAFEAEQASGPNFQFVDPTLTGSPFIGHELCTIDPYFNNLSWPTDWSFHPNLEGQQAYADIIASYL